MKPTFPETRDMVPPCLDNCSEAYAAARSAVLPEGFLGRQLSAAGLETVAEKILAGRDLQCDDALALCNASLPLLAKMVQLRALASDDGNAPRRRDLVDPPPAGGDACDPATASLPVERVAELPSAGRFGQRLADWDSFCRTLIAARSQVFATGGAVSWHPILQQPLDRDQQGEGGESGAEVLRAIALARLLLPAEIEVQAPLATLGPKLAQVALDFGASHLGYAAPDGQSSGDPLIADFRALDELVQSISRTETT